MARVGQKPKRVPKAPREFTPVQQAASDLAKARAKKLGPVRCKAIALIAVRAREERRARKRREAAAEAATLARPPQGAVA